MIENPNEPMKCVYAGPDYFANKQESEDQSQEKDSNESNSEVTPQDKPSFPSTPPSDQTMMMTYAGPDFYNRNPQGFMFMGAAMPDTYKTPVYPENHADGSDSDEKNYCTSCGFKFEVPSKFCPECGSPRQQ
jgi:hypothetical protein